MCVFAVLMISVTCLVAKVMAMILILILTVTILKIIIVMSATTSSYAGNEKVKNTDTNKKSTYEIAIFSKSLVSLDSLHGFTNHFLRYLSL